MVLYSLLKIFLCSCFLFSLFLSSKIVVEGYRQATKQRKQDEKETVKLNPQHPYRTTTVLPPPPAPPPPAPPAPALTEEEAILAAKSEAAVKQLLAKLDEFVKEDRKNLNQLHRQITKMKLPKVGEVTVKSLSKVDIVEYDRALYKKK